MFEAYRDQFENYRMDVTDPRPHFYSFAAFGKKICPYATSFGPGVGGGGPRSLTLPSEGRPVSSRWFQLCKDECPLSKWVLATIAQVCKSCFMLTESERRDFRHENPHWDLLLPRYVEDDIRYPGTMRVSQVQQMMLNHPELTSAFTFNERAPLSYLRGAKDNVGGDLAEFTHGIGTRWAEYFSMNNF